MSSPNEPGYSPAGDGSGPTGSAQTAAGAPAPGTDTGTAAGSSPRSDPQQPGSGPAHGAEHGDVPPWQRGPAARARQQPPPDAPRAGGQPGLDARLNRFISGGAAPEPEPPSRNERTGVVRPDGERREGNRPGGSRPKRGGRAGGVA